MTMMVMMMMMFMINDADADADADTNADDNDDNYDDTAADDDHDDGKRGLNELILGKDINPLFGGTHKMLDHKSNLRYSNSFSSRLLEEPLFHFHVYGSSADQKVYLMGQ